MNAQPVEQHYEGLEAVLNAVASWITRYRQQRQARHEFSQCDAEEVAQIAHDLGISSAELREVASKGPESAALLGRMLTTLGVDANELDSADPAVMRDLQRLCVSCGHKQQCMHEFDAGTAAAHYHEFCPNAYTLDALLAQKKH